MKSPRRKSARDIKVRIVHRTVNDGLISSIKTTAEVPLNVKLYDYVVRLGYTSSHLIGFVVQLFTKGKVRVDFSNYTERLELINNDDRLTGAQAMQLFEDFVQEIGDSVIAKQSLDATKTTQRILVLHPKKSDRGFPSDSSPKKDT